MRALECEDIVVLFGEDNPIVRQHGGEERGEEEGERWLCQDLSGSHNSNPKCTTLRASSQHYGAVPLGSFKDEKGLGGNGSGYRYAAVGHYLH
jgi:hypothetical protein